MNRRTRAPSATELILSLSKIIDEGRSKRGDWKEGYKKRLGEVDAALASKDRERRGLVRERRRLEVELDDVEGAIALMGEGDRDNPPPSLETFLEDKGKLGLALSALDLSIASVDRERRSLRKERGKLERAIG